LSQTVDNLDTSKSYTLSFEYAGAQQGLNSVDFNGDTTQKWLVDGISASQITVGPWTNPSKGFTPWQTYTTTFTPTSTSINLAFTAWGNVVGGGEPTGLDSLPPFLLLDNVQILETNTPPPPPPPAPRFQAPCLYWEWELPSRWPVACASALKCIPKSGDPIPPSPPAARSEATSLQVV
jgi:hypothetical protein